MTGSLIKLDEVIVSSAVSSVTLGDTNWDSSYNVYLVKYQNVSPSTAEQMKARFLVSGYENSTSNYQYAVFHQRTSGAFENLYGTGQAQMNTTSSQIHATTGNSNGTLFIFNANISDEFTFITNETVQWAGSNQVSGDNGGNVFRVATAINGIKFFIASSHNIDSGTFSLYALRK